MTLDPKAAPAEYNYRNKAEMEAAVGHTVLMEGEEHGLSVFFRLDEDVFHTYSVYARGTESITDSALLNPGGIISPGIQGSNGFAGIRIKTPESSWGWDIL